MTGLPWITVVLLVALAVGGVELLRPNSYAAQATVTAPDVRTADSVSTTAAEDLVVRVEEEIELGPDFVGSVGLAVDHARDDRDVHVHATAPDPRLAALSADTAAVLLITDRSTGDAGLELSSTAQVPAEPVRQRSLTWIWIALVALALAIWVEGAHRIWLRTRPGPAAPDGAS